MPTGQHRTSRSSTWTSLAPRPGSVARPIHSSRPCPGGRSHGAIPPFAFEVGPARAVATRVRAWSSRATYVHMERDPRVETLTSWARSEGKLSDRAATALAALDESLPSPATAPALAYAVSAAYARVPGTGPRDLRAGNRLVRILAQLGEAGARELLGMQEAVTYRHARNAIRSALAELERRSGVPDPELEDEFAGVKLDVDLKTLVPVGPFAAVVGVTPDLRRVQTKWRDEAGGESARRPPSAPEFAHDLDVVEDVRRRLRAHVTALRYRLERAMIVGKPWTAEEWRARMFGDPLRAAMARRLIWRADYVPVLVLPGGDGLRNLGGDQVNIRPQTPVRIWHPADDPAAQED